MEYIKTERSSQSPSGIENHEIFFQKKKQSSSYKPQATSLKPRAGGTQKVQAPGVGGPIVHKRVIHRLSTEKIFSILLMGFSMKRWEHEKSKNYCSCQPAHDQIQPEKPRGVSGSNGKAQRQNLLRSRGDLPRRINNLLSTIQTSKLWGCVLGRDRGRCDSLRLDRGSPGEASLHQVKASNDSQTWNTSFCSFRSLRHSLQLRNLRKNYRSISLNQVHPDLGTPPNIKTHKQQALKHQA